MNHKFKFIDFHTHSKDFSSENFLIHNFIYQEDFQSLNDLNNLINRLPSHHKFTIGPHPWFLSEYIKNQNEFLKEFQEILKAVVEKELFFGLGEFGLDRGMKKRIDGLEKKERFQIQMELLERLIGLAIDLEIKNLVLHVVKSYGDLVPYIKINSKFKFIFHDYQGDQNLTKKLNDFNHVFYSISPDNKYLKNNDWNTSLFNLDKFFLETDDKKTKIDDFYYIMEDIYSRRDLKEIIFKNFDKQF